MAQSKTGQKLLACPQWLILTFKTAQVRNKTAAVLSKADRPFWNFAWVVLPLGRSSEKN